MAQYQHLPIYKQTYDILLRTMSDYLSLISCQLPAREASGTADGWGKTIPCRTS
jgi:hypothetical protein